MGLVLVEHKVAISEDSIIIRYSDSIHEAASAIFFQGNNSRYWNCNKMRRDAYVDNLIAFGRKNLPEVVHYLLFNLVRTIFVLRHFKTVS